MLKKLVKIPKDWKIVKINEVMWFQEGPGVRNNQFTPSGVKLLNVSNIVEGFIDLNKTKIYISEEEAYVKYKHFLVNAGDLIIASSGIKVENFEKKVAFIEEKHLPLCMNTSTIRFKVIDNNLIDMKYFCHFLKSIYFKKQVQHYITGSAQLNFGPSHLNKMKLILPPIKVQKQLAEILDKADELRLKRKLANQKLDEFLQSTFLDMFGDPVLNSKKWNKEKLENSILFITSGSRGWAQYYTSTGEIFIRIGNVKNTKLLLDDIQYVTSPKSKEAERTKVQKDDLLISITADLGRTAVVDEKTATIGAYINQHLCLLRLRENISSKYLAYFIESKAGKAQINKANQVGVKSGLNFDAIKNLSINVPPIELQKEFVQIVEKVEEQKAKNEAQIQKLDDLFNSLLQRAFKGELEFNKEVALK